jgi:hypothetical protein
MVMRILVLFLAFVSLPAAAQHIYKCKTASGTMIYQQTPCPSSTRTESVRTYVPAPDSPTPPPEPEIEPEHQYSAAPSYDTYEGPPQRDYAAEEQRRKLLSDIDDQITHLGVLDSRSKRELAAKLRATQAEVVTGSRSAGTSTYEEAPAPPIHRVEETRTIRDQYGNQYTQPPGSAFVTDQKTGKQCFKYGDFVKCD